MNVKDCVLNVLKSLRQMKPIRFTAGLCAKAGVTAFRKAKKLVMSVWVKQ
jgi:hypothetical protein